MFPDFMTDILNQARCGHCNAPQAIDDIQIVGVRRPEDFEAFYAEPVFAIVMGCKACGQWTNHAIRRSRADAIAGCVSFIQLIEQDCQGKKRPLNIPGLGQKPNPAPAPTPSQRTAEARPRPSIRDDQPDTPPTQREIQFFLQRLRKTSFRRGSKGFRNWLDDIGAERPPTDDSGTNSSTP